MTNQIYVLLGDKKIPCNLKDLKKCNRDVTKQEIQYKMKSCSLQFFSWLDHYYLIKSFYLPKRLFFCSEQFLLRYPLLLAENGRTYFLIFCGPIEDTRYLVLHSSDRKRMVACSFQMSLIIIMPLIFLSYLIS